MPTRIDRNQVQRLLDEGAQLVEALPQAGYENENMPAAINIPLRSRPRARPGSGARAPGHRLLYDSHET
jgi:hypothetical protein